MLNARCCFSMTARRAQKNRATRETAIDVELDLDGSGQAEIETGIGFFDHMLDLLARHARWDLKIRAKGDLTVDFHHTVEDTGIVLGQALQAALGTKIGIQRYGWALLPMDECLAQIAIDLSGRPFLAYEVPPASAKIGEFDFELVEEFFRALTMNSGMSLHATIVRGGNLHHQAEALFKGLARALRQACTVDPTDTSVPSTKGVL
jgi:imidazoleglycerol-phosphate dehydratase